MGTQAIKTIIEVTAIPPITKIIDGKKSIECMVAMPSNATPLTTEPKLLETPIPRKMQGTSLNLKDLLSGIGYIALSTAWYFLEDARVDADNDLINDLQAVGLGASVINIWEVPEMFIDIAGSFISGKYSSTGSNPIAGQLRITQNKIYVDNFNYTPPVPVYNNKARYGQSATVTVFSPCSGAKITKKIYDVLPLGESPNQASYNLPYTIGADIRPNGSPIFCWNYNDGGTDQRDRLAEHIVGGTWKKTTITAEGSSGSYFDKLTIRMQENENAKSLAGGILGGVLQAGIGVATGNPFMITGGIADAVSSGSKYIETNDRLKNQEKMLNARSVSASTNLQIGNSDYARDTGRNWFYSCMTSYSAEDMVNFDMFLTRYGYNVGDMHIGTQHFWCRSDFVFIQVNYINIVSKKVNKEILDNVEEQLKAGVRIWRVKPNIDSMNPSGNRGACPEDV